MRNAPSVPETAVATTAPSQATETRSLAGRKGAVQPPAGVGPAQNWLTVVPTMAQPSMGMVPGDVPGGGPGCGGWPQAPATPAIPAIAARAKARPSRRWFMFPSLRDVDRPARD